MNISGQENHIIMLKDSINLSNTSSTINILPEEEILGATLTTAYYSILGIQGFFIIVVNLLTVVCVCKYEFLWEECSSRIILSLACSDLLAGIRYGIPGGPRKKLLVLILQKQPKTGFEIKKMLF